MSFGPDRFNAPIGSSTFSPIHQCLVNILFAEIDGFRLTDSASHSQTLGDSIDGDDTTGIEHPGTLDSKLTDGTTAPHCHGFTRLNLGILGSHVSRRQY